MTDGHSEGYLAGDRQDMLSTYVAVGQEGRLNSHVRAQGNLHDVVQEPETEETDWRQHTHHRLRKHQDASQILPKLEGRNHVVQSEVIEAI